MADANANETRGLTVTLHDVAARAGVSIATVSRALNGLAVSKDSLAKVKKASDELGYVANEAARSLRSDRTMTMGMIFRRLDSSAGLELLDALTATVEAAGYSLFVSTARGDDEHYDTLMRRFLERRVDAVFCAHPGGSGAMLERYRAAGVPVATVFKSDGGFQDLPLIYPTVEAASDIAAERLAALGHKRAALILGEDVRGPMLAVRQALKTSNIAIQTRPIAEGPLDAAAWIAAWREMPQRPTCVFASIADISQLLRAAFRQDVRVPDDLSLIAITDLVSKATGMLKPPSTIQVDGRTLGAAAAHMMLDWLGGTIPPPVQKVSVGSWVERATTGPAPLSN